MFMKTIRFVFFLLIIFGGCSYLFAKDDSSSVLSGINILRTDDLGNKIFFSLNDGKEGLLNSKNEIIVSPVYDFISFEKSYYYVEKGTSGNVKKGILDSSGKVVLDCVYDSIFDRGIGYFKLSKNGKEGVADYDGNIIIDIKYKSVWYYESKDVYVVEAFNGTESRYKLEGTSKFQVTNRNKDSSEFKDLNDPVENAKKIAAELDAAVDAYKKSTNTIKDIPDTKEKKSYKNNTEVQYDAFSLFSYKGPVDRYGNRVVMYKGKYGVADSTGWTIIACIYDSIYWSNNYSRYVCYNSTLNSTDYYSSNGTMVAAPSNSNSYSNYSKQLISCPSCHGTGWGDVRYPPAYDGKRYYMDLKEKCSKYPYCSERYIHSHDRCRRCKGTGTIQQ